MIKFGIIMEPLEGIVVKKNSSFAMLLEAQRRGFTNYHIDPKEIWLQDEIIWARLSEVEVRDDKAHYFACKEKIVRPLNELNILLMRQEPPVDLEFIYITYLLEIAEKQGLKIVNKPKAIRNANEKLSTTRFPQCCPKTLVTSQADTIKNFLQQYQEIIIKPLHSMGGDSVFYVRADDVNKNVIIDTMTRKNQNCVMVQQFIPEIKNGDKRILLINGEPIPFALVRLPKEGDFRGNMVLGGKQRTQPLSEQDLWICQQVGPELKKSGLLFVGIDIIGDYLTEINVTSPTGIRELDALHQLNIAGQFFDALISYANL